MTDAIILTASDVRRALKLDDCIRLIEDALVDDANGNTIPSGVLATHVDGGGFHVKTAGLKGKRNYYVAKINANRPGNSAQFGLPTIQGVLALFDTLNGRVLAVMDSAEITTIRTAAMTAVAAKHLAAAHASSLTILGCGVQGREHVRSISRVRKLREVLAWDVRDDLAKEFATAMSAELHINVAAVQDYRAATKSTDMVVTCTPSHQPLLNRDDVRPGTFIGAVGADNGEKIEIAPELMANAEVVVDVLEQCLKIGDLHHAVEAGVMTGDDVYGTLRDIVAGTLPKPNQREIIIFDSTGTALTDVAAASAVYETVISRQ